MGCCPKGASLIAPGRLADRQAGRAYPDWRREWSCDVGAARGVDRGPRKRMSSPRGTEWARTIAVLQAQAGNRAVAALLSRSAPVQQRTAEPTAPGTGAAAAQHPIMTREAAGEPAGANRDQQPSGAGASSSAATSEQLSDCQPKPSGTWVPDTSDPAIEVPGATIHQRPLVDRRLHARPNQRHSLAALKMLHADAPAHLAAEHATAPVDVALISAPGVPLTRVRAANDDLRQVLPTGGPGGGAASLRPPGPRLRRAGRREDGNHHPGRTVLESLPSPRASAGARRPRP